MANTALVNPRTISDPSEKAKEQFQNLVKQLPGEATGIYLAGMSFFAGDILWLTIAAVVGLVVLLWVRARAKVSTTIWATSIIGYFVWIYAIGNGPLQALTAAIGLTLPAMFGAFIVVVYTTIITILAVKPPASG